MLDQCSHKSYLTAITRKDLPVPVRFLCKHNMIQGNVLDFGCGKCKKINDLKLGKLKKIKSITSFDPYFHEIKLNPNFYDCILCTYVLCTLPLTEEKIILKRIQSLLSKNGMAFISVRNDVPIHKLGESSKGTYQRQVSISYLHELKKCSAYSIYVLTPDSNIPIV